MAEEHSFQQPKGPVPYLFSKNSCNDHMNWIVKHLNGKINYSMPDDKDSSKIIHAAMTVNGGPLYFSDRLGAYGSPVPEAPSSLNTHLYMGFNTLPEGQKAWDSAIQGGSKIVLDFKPTDWGSHYGVCEDPFAAVWAVCVHGTGKKDGEETTTEESKKTKADGEADPDAASPLKKSKSTD